jgi:hypothetical protein
LLQKEGSAIVRSISASCSSGRAASKMPPQFEGTTIQIFVIADQFFVESHVYSYLTLAL